MNRRLLIAVCALVLIACFDGDTAPPKFRGLESAVAQSRTTALLTWRPARDLARVITYNIYYARRSGEEDFAAPLTSVVDQTSTVIEGLYPGAGLKHYFVVRALDQAGNEDRNTAEASVVLQANGISLVSQYLLDGAADVASSSDGNTVAVNGWRRDTVDVFDVTDKSNPILAANLGEIGYNGDLEIMGNLLYVAHEHVGHGLDIYDISDPYDPNLVAEIGPANGYPAAMEDCHTVWLQPDRSLLYCASIVDGGLQILSTGEGSVGTPTAPVHLSSVQLDGDWGIHDMYASGNTLYGAFLDAGIGIWDITDPADPILIARELYDAQFTHNLWLAHAGEYLLSTDENDGGHLKIWDIRNLPDITLAAEYQSNADAIIHNVEVIDDYAYISYYTDGVKVVDLSDPTQPIEVGSFDTHDGPDSDGFEGLWGVEPIPPYVFGSDLNTGLWVFHFEAPPIGPPTVPEEESL